MIQCVYVFPLFPSISYIYFYQVIYVSLKIWFNVRYSYFNVIFLKRNMQNQKNYRINFKSINMNWTVIWINNKQHWRGKIILSLFGMFSFLKNKTNSIFVINSHSLHFLSSLINLIWVKTCCLVRKWIII